MYRQNVMSKAIAFLVLFLSAIGSYSQQKESFLFRYTEVKRNDYGNAAQYQLFTTAFQSGTNPAVSHAQYLQLNKKESRLIWTQKPAFIRFSIPYTTETFDVELFQEDIAMAGTETGILSQNKTQQIALASKPLHYRGYIKAFPNSAAAVTFFPDGELMALLINENGNYNLAQKADKDYILYNSRDLKALPPFSCDADERPASHSPANPVSPQTAQVLAAAATSELCNKVRFYWEADYKLFINDFSGNVESTINYLSGLFNQVAVLYLNDGIPIELSGLYVWTGQSPYNTSSSINALTGLRQRWDSLGNTFKGDICMLIDGSPTNNGGRAYILGLNLCQRNFAYGYANIHGSYNTVPVYSWDVEVITHEAGHLLGSHHTHWCGWLTDNGHCGAIDDCYTVEAFDTCATCNALTTTTPAAPAGFQGTIMSYCHLRSGIGINLVNGFGPLPRKEIKTNISLAACLTQKNVWTGAVSDAWEDPANWSCGTIPTAKTDVTVPGRAANQPVIRFEAVCRKLKQETFSHVNVVSGVLFSILGE